MENSLWRSSKPTGRLDKADRLTQARAGNSSLFAELPCIEPFGQRREIVGPELLYSGDQLSLLEMIGGQTLSQLVVECCYRFVVGGADMSHLGVLGLMLGIQHP